MNKLTNCATINGIYNNLETIIQSNIVSVSLINNLEISKCSNKTLWASGTLRYTITINNISDTTLNNIVITDILNPEYISLIVESVRINGVPAGYDILKYNKNNGTMIINIPNIDANECIEIDFKVQKKCLEIFKLDNIATLSYDNNNIYSNIVSVNAIPSLYKCKEK